MRIIWGKLSSVWQECHKPLAVYIEVSDTRAWPSTPTQGQQRWQLPLLHCSWICLHDKQINSQTPISNPHSQTTFRSFASHYFILYCLSKNCLHPITFCTNLLFKLLSRSFFYIKKHIHHNLQFSFPYNI